MLAPFYVTDDVMDDVATSLQIQHLFQKVLLFEKH